MNIANHDVAVCSWSLRTTGIAELVEVVRRLGLGHVQLALLDLVRLDEAARNRELSILRESGIGLTAGMIHFPGEDYSSIPAIHRTGGFAPDERWPERRKLAADAARLAHELGVNRLSTHVGFIPAKTAGQYPPFRDRVRDVAADFADAGVNLLMETGQEPADELLCFLQDLNASNVGINFDPANLILYGAGDPIDAVRALGSYIRHVHVKDAVPSSRPGEQWGEEVAFGTGQVGPARYLAALHAIGYTGPLAIEREAGDDRVGDIRRAIDALDRAAGV